MGELTLTDDQHEELHRLLRFYHAESRRCRAAKAYLAGCVVAGAALETVLILMVGIYDEEAAATGSLPRQKGRIKPLLSWNLAELLTVAKAANWLPSGLHYGMDDWDHRKAKAGDYAEVVREMRNLAHPARYVEAHHGKRVTRKHLEWVLDSVDTATSWLLARVEESLVEAMKAEGWVPEKQHRSAKASRRRAPKATGA
jgi:hypothetical protein